MSKAQKNKVKLNSLPSITDFGAVGVGDESAAANAMISATNSLRVPPGFTLTCKNIQLFNNTTVFVEGALKLPNACSDYDRLLYADQKTGITISAKEIDGNYSNQSGNIGTHLIYLTRCTDSVVDIDYVHDHYIGGGAPLPSIDGFRNASTGAIWLYRCIRPVVNIRLLAHWGREGFYLEECTKADATVGHCQAHPTRNTEYSGIQVSGVGSRLHRASVDFAGASGIGFDVIDGALSNVLVTRTRENHGVNFGHFGFPSSGSVASNIVVDGAWLDGIKVSSATVDLVVDNFTVKNVGRYGISVSDNSLRGKFSSGVVQEAGQANIQVASTEIQTDNVRYSAIDARSLVLTVSSGSFVDGETVTSPGGKTATVRKALRNLTGNQATLLLTGVTGTFAVSDVVTGGTSGATGTVSLVSTPTQRLEQTGGIIADDVRLFPGTQDQIRFPDGTAIMTATAAVVIATPATLTNTVVNYSSNVVWANAPRVVAQVTSANSTGNYTITQVEASSTTTQLNLDVIASVAQTYGINVFAIGRWK